MFGGVLHIAGPLAVAAPVRSIALCLPGGDRLALRCVAAGPGRVSFDQTVAVPTEIAAAWLLVTVSDGAEFRLDELGAAGSDPRHELASRFRTMLAERPPGLLLEVGSRARSGFVRRDRAQVTGEGAEAADRLAVPIRAHGGDVHAGADIDRGCIRMCD